MPSYNRVSRAGQAQLDVEFIMHRRARQQGATPPERQRLMTCLVAEIKRRALGSGVESGGTRPIRRCRVHRRDQAPPGVVVSGIDCHCSIVRGRSGVDNAPLYGEIGGAAALRQ